MYNRIGRGGTVADRKTHRPVCGVAVSCRFLQPCSTELFKAEVEAVGRRFMLSPPRAPAGLPVVHTAALLASSSGLVLKHGLAFCMTLIHHLGQLCHFSEPHSVDCRVLQLSCKHVFFSPKHVTCTRSMLDSHNNKRMRFFK